MQHTVETAKAGEMGARQLASMAYGTACSGTAELLGLLFKALARAVERRVIEFDAQGLANTMWAFATLDQLDE